MTTNISMLAIDLAKGSFQVCAIRLTTESNANGPTNIAFTGIFGVITSAALSRCWRKG